MNINRFSKIALAKAVDKRVVKGILNTGDIRVDSGSVGRSMGAYTLPGNSSTNISVKTPLKGARGANTDFNWVAQYMYGLPIGSEGRQARNVGSHLPQAMPTYAVKANGSNSNGKVIRKKQPDAVTSTAGSSRGTTPEYVLHSDVDKLKIVLTLDAILRQGKGKTTAKFTNKANANKSTKGSTAKVKNSGRNRKGNTVAQNQPEEASTGSMLGGKDKQQQQTASRPVAETHEVQSQRVTPTPTAEAASASNQQAGPSHPFLSRLGQGILDHFSRNRGIYGALGGGIVGSTATNILSGGGGSGITQEDLLRMSQWQQAYTMALDQRSFWQRLFGDMQSVQGNFQNNLKNYGWTDQQIKAYRKRFAGVK